MAKRNWLRVWVDQTGLGCRVIGCKGVYGETSVMDDIQGVLHCSYCNDETPRYITKKDVYPWQKPKRNE